MTDPAIEGMRLAEKATPGPWKLWGSEVRADPTGTSDLKDSVLVCDPVMTPDPENGRLRCPDSYFIAHAGTHYASICKRALDAESKVAAMARVVEAAVELARADAECSAAMSAIGTEEEDDVTRPFQARIAHDHAVEGVCAAVRAMKEKRDHE